MQGEPVRGVIPEPWFSSLPGIERAHALRQGLISRPPLARLMGMRVTQVSPGAATMMLPASPWLDPGSGMEFLVVGEVALSTAVLTGAPAGSDVRTASLSVTQFRPASLDADLIAHARTLTSAPRFTFGEVAIEDARGRAVAGVTGAVLVHPRDPPPPPAPPLGPVDEPTYSTPDPHLRPLPAEVRAVPSGYWERFDGLTLIRRLVSQEPPPFLSLLGGLSGVEVDEGQVRGWTMPATEWFCYHGREVAPAVLAVVAYIAATGAGHTLTAPGHRLGVLDMSFSFLRSATPDGRSLVVDGRVTERQDDLVLASATVTDGDGHRLATLHQTGLLLPARRRPQPSAESILATVLFTDLVGSTARLRELGDERWQVLLGEHQAVVRRHLEAFRGREVKTTGDGFLATFDSPARALKCALAARAGVEALGLELRAGIHTGECEILKGDVSGIAVHLAARVLGAAAPGEVLVSGTVRDLLLGSDFSFEDRGRHKLKGIEGEWQLFAVQQ
jgi:class 3 adenylate cyclase